MIYAPVYVIELPTDRIVRRLLKRSNRCPHAPTPALTARSPSRADSISNAVTRTPGWRSLPRYSELAAGSGQRHSAGTDGASASATAGTAAAPPKSAAKKLRRTGGEVCGAGTAGEG